MKILSLITLLLLSSISFSQTAVISAKSHAGDISQLLKEPDNFGEMAPIPQYDSIILIKDNCIIEIGSKWGDWKFRDTICEHWWLKEQDYTLEAAKQRYGTNATFIGFKEKKKQNDDSDTFWINRKPSQNNLFGLLGFIVLSYLAFLITPVFKKSK